jgi:hypothetical protein
MGDLNLSGENLGQDPVPATPSPSPSRPGKKHRPEVVPVRNLREYIGESILIVFSVLLALILTEIINGANERKATRALLQDIRAELIHNKKVVEDQYQYHLSIIRRIDSVRTHPELVSRFLVNGEINFDLVVPYGVLKGDLLAVAWDVAKSQNIASRTDIPTLELLTDIYNDQERIIKVEDEVGKVVLNPESREPENVRITLILIRDNFKAWATGRVPGLLAKYQRAIDHLAEK